MRWEKKSVSVVPHIDLLHRSALLSKEEKEERGEGGMGHIKARIQ